MKVSQKMPQALVSSLLATGTFVMSAPASLAQSPAPTTTVQTKAPSVAPTLMKKAGQMLFDNAQKNMLHNMNQMLQGQGSNTSTSGQTQGSTPAGTIDPTGQPTLLPQTTVGVSQAPCRSWVDPQTQPIACLLCIHGLGLQSNSYEFFGKEQSKRGLAVYAIDVRGFGSWMKANGKTKVNFDDCLADIKQTLTSIRAANPGLPVYILGESMGGAIALRAASMYPELVDGLISSVPAGERFKQEKTSMKVFLNLLTGVNIAYVGNDLVNQATQNAKLKSQWEGDPLSRLNLTPQELIQFQDFMNNNHEAAKKVANMPVLFVQGNGDQLVKPEGTWELFNSVAAKDKSFFAVPGEHLIFEEAQTQDAGPRDQNLRVISSWLNAKVGRRKGGWMGRRDPDSGAPQSGNYQPGTNGGGAAAGGYPNSSYNGGYGSNSPSGNGAGYPGGMGMGGGRMPMGRWVNTQGLETQAQLIESGDYAKAIVSLENARNQDPNNPNVYALLGRAYFLGGQPENAGRYFRTAMRMSGRGGTDQARNLNSYLLSLAQTVAPGAANAQSAGAAAGVPFLGFGSQPGAVSTVAAAAGISGMPASRGKVYAFFANWADQCKGMNDSLNQLSGTFGNRIDITRVNVEDAGAAALVDQFKVGPIPTVVFVSPDGRVSSTIIGESSINNYEKAFQAIDRN